MENEYFGAATTPMDNYLAHYGVRGMKWGVRKAIASGNKARLGRQYAKAQKKLAKLEKQAANSKKYARRAAALGVGAAAAGGLAAAGTGGVARGIARVGGASMKAKKAIGVGMVRAGQLASKIPGASKAAGKVIGAGYTLQTHGNIGGKTFTRYAKASKAINDWGKSTSISDAARKGLGQAQFAIGRASKTAGRATLGATGGAAKRLTGVSNNTIARIGAGAIGAGLAAGAARNAYKAATAQKRAAQFRSEMNKAFAGTQYANGGSRSSSKKRRRR